MPPRHTPIDFVAYDAAGKVVLLAEAKSRGGTSDSWAAKLRRNMLSHDTLPKSQFFLIATPTRMYGWNQEHLLPIDAPPQFTVDTKKALQPYFAKITQDPDDISPKAFELLIHAWLTDVAHSRGDQLTPDPSLSSLIESGLLSSLREAEIEMNAGG